MLVTLNPRDFTGVTQEIADQYGRPNPIDRNQKDALKFMRWYARKFRLKSNIKEGQTVERVTRLGEGQNNEYEIIYRGTISGTENKVLARNVIFATGIYPSGIGTLNIEGEDKFSNRIIYLHGKKDAAKLRFLKGKAVVVVGAGLSGVLITLELRKIAKAGGVGSILNPVFPGRMIPYKKCAKGPFLTG